MIRPHICVIGFGNIGCRHAQSFLNKQENFKLSIVEPNKKVFSVNSKTIGANVKSLKRFDHFSDIKEYCDLIIVSTLSNIRYDVLRALDKDIFQQCLVEKIVFQSIAEFKEFDKIRINRTNNYYVNFVNRYFDVNIDIKNKVKNTKNFTLEVFGGNFNLGSNGVHYIDLFEYITGETCDYVEGKVTEFESVSKRGPAYKSYTGKANFITKSNHKLRIISDCSLPTTNTYLRFIMDKTQCFVDEAAGIVYENSLGKDITISKYNVIPSSILTYNIYKDIVNHRCQLPKIQEVINCHKQHFSALFNKKIQVTEYKKVFPVT